MGQGVASRDSSRRTSPGEPSVGDHAAPQGQAAVGKQSRESGAGWGNGPVSSEAGALPRTPLPAWGQELSRTLPCPSAFTPAVSVPPRTPEAECPDPKETLLWLGLGS